MKKQILAGCTAALLALTAAQGMLAGAADSATVYVTIANAGKLAIAREEVAVTDLDGDGALTVADALAAAHEKCFAGGAAAGFAVSDSQWGKSVSKLWGVENGGSYSYTVNNIFSNGPTDPVKTGDKVYAGVMQNVSGNYDSYTYFDPEDAEVTAGEAFTLTLNEAGWDESYNQIANPLKDAVITVNGKDTGRTTDAQGKVTLTLDEAGIAEISAKSSAKTIFPPIALVTVKAAETTAASGTEVSGDGTAAAGETETTAASAEDSAEAESGTGDAEDISGSADGNQPAPKAGEGVPEALAVTAVLTLGAAFVLRRRDAE